jgi:hypothetical protein
MNQDIRQEATYALRHDVPIPLKGSTRPGRKHGPPVTVAGYIESARLTMLKMTVGDCFLVPIGTVPGQDHDHLLGTISLQAGYVLGRGNFVAVAVQDGVCVWRTR